MDFTSVLFGILFSAFGILFAMGQIHSRMKTWIEMPDEEKAQIRIAPLCLNIGEVITGCGLLFLINGIWAGFRAHWFSVAVIIWLAIACADVVFISKSDRYRVKNK